VSFSVKGLGAAASAEPAATLLRLACPLLTTRGLPMGEAVGAIRAAAEGVGVDLTAGAGLGRLSDRVVYVLGASARDQSKPQLWVYKDTRAPARLIAQSGADLRLLQYGDPAAADWFPRVFELWERGQLSARFEVFETRGVRVAGEEDEDDSRD
jgi:hypothetical protein